MNNYFIYIIPIIIIYQIDACNNYFLKYLYIIIKRSAYLAISFLKQTPLPEKQLRISLS